jgi:hypothetical protein
MKLQPEPLVGWERDWKTVSAQQKSNQEMQPVLLRARGKTTPESGCTRPDQKKVLASRNKKKSCYQAERQKMEA